MRTKLATVAAVGALAVGGAALLAPSMASAQPADGQGRFGVLASVLQDLVADGTLDRAQAEKVADRLEGAMPLAGHMGGRGLGLGGPTAVAEVLGISVQELHEAHMDGDTLADIAQEKGVSRDQLVDRLVAAAEARLDEAVADERLTAEQAQERKATLEDRISRMVDREPTGRGHGPGRGNGPLHGLMHQD